MNAEELKPILEQAIKGEFQLIWLAVGAITFIVSVVSVFVVSYMKTKGANLATKEDFQSINAQLAAKTITTEDIKTAFAAMHARTVEEIKTEFLASQVTTTEQIRAEISNNYLNRQEWSKTRRAKLEELVNCAFELQQVVNDDANKLRLEFYSGSDSIFNTMPTQILKIEMLSTLYFYDELCAESLDLILSFMAVQNKIIEQFKLHKKLISGQITDPNILHETDLPAETGRLHRVFKNNFTSFQKKARETLDTIARI